MKHLYLFAFIIFWGFAASAQTLGVKINPGAEVGQASKTQFNMSCGLYYDQKIYRFLGISTGIEYTQIRSGPGIYALSAIGNFSEFAEPAQVRTNLFEVPVDIKFLFNENELKKCLAYFTIGYAVGDVFELQNVYNENGVHYFTREFMIPSKEGISNSFRMGIETCYNPKPGINLAFGVQYKFIVMPGFNTGNSDGANIVGAYVKTGLNFLHKKAAVKKS